MTAEKVEAGMGMGEGAFVCFAFATIHDKRFEQKPYSLGARGSNASSWVSEVDQEWLRSYSPWEMEDICRMPRNNRTSARYLPSKPSIS